MNTAVHPKIAAILRRIGQLPESTEITPGQKLQDDLGIDSLKLIDVVVNVEEELGVVLDDEDIHGFGTVGDIDRYVAGLTGS
ncbi:phosphopantetheine-binding protein [Planotetraspora sp. A-T 1434]|uniref:acyl carrier protein n=1 Tax=Planotetraspora sp. A-T 1434 TaxID=2979219 RepID=UPI0021C00A71|nr:phosphopantetheine-binding protein [Planotetraspora sp. A-T 1434]MCT9935337.1 phosphopantetheine-binding protein [Planotetraspora sp. A-T 1434]